MNLQVVVEVIVVVVVVVVVEVVVAIVVEVVVVVGARGGDGSYVGTEKIQYILLLWLVHMSAAFYLPPGRINLCMFMRASSKAPNSSLTTIRNAYT